MTSDKLYLWKLQNEEAKVTAKYQIHITASNSWEADAPYKVKVKLLSKNYYIVKIDSAKVILNIGSFTLESLSEKEPAILREPADYWEKTFTFDIPLDKLVSGKNFTVSAVAVISISNVPESTWELNGTWNNFDKSVTARLHFTSQSESILNTIVMVSMTSVTLVSASILIYFKKRKQ